MKPSKVHLRVLALVVALVALVPAASASRARVEGVQALSLGSVLVPCDNPLAPTATLETDTRVAVNLMENPRNIVASWTEGIFLGTIVSVSKDGGESWKQVAVPGHSGCSGDKDDTSAADPAVAFDADGTLYVASLNFNIFSPQRERVLVSRSGDGGENWEPNRENNAPTEVDGYYSTGVSDASNGELDLTTDPRVPQRAYLVWTKRKGGLDQRSEDADWQTYFSRTTDGGNTWTPARSIYDTAKLVFPWNNIIRPLGQGRLLIAFQQVDNGAPESRFEVLSIRSDDNGDTWSTTPARIGESCGNAPRDGETALAIAHNPKPSLDVAPDGTAYAAWHAIRCGDPPSSQIRVAKSTDGGRSWTPLPAVKDNAAQAFLPMLAVAPNGVIGVTYYDLRNDVPGDGRLTVDVWFSHSHDGSTWKEEHLAGPFEASTSVSNVNENDPNSINHKAVTDLNGLAALPHGFAASFVQTAPAALEPPTDIFFARLFTPGRGDGEKATGGGWLADRAGGKINFGFTVHETVFGFEGDLQLNDKAAGAKIHLRQVTSLGPIGSTCGSVEAGPGSVELLGSGTFNGTAASFRVCVQDNGEGAGAGPDRFFLACTAGCGYSTGSRTPDDAIDGGNIQVGDDRNGSESLPTTMILDPLLRSEASAGDAVTFTVTVYDQRQEPLANANVTLTATTSGGRVETVSAVSDGAGTATFPATPLAGEYMATAGSTQSNAIELTPLR